MTEVQFIKFARDLGVRLSGVVEGDPGEFNRRGWLPGEEVVADRRILFHPFRLYTVHRVLKRLSLPIAPSASLNCERLPELVNRVLAEQMPSLEDISHTAAEANLVVDLATCLEPLYWPDITGWTVRSGGVDIEEHNRLLRHYQKNATVLVESLDPQEWQKAHEKVRLDAAMLDENGSLYLLLRVARWDRRKRLRGAVAAGLWFRHMAEVIRRVFESVHKVVWPEEDRGFGQWSHGDRTLVYGSERPLDDIPHSRPRLTLHFGLATGSAVRWYVEGDTEYQAILSIMPEPAKANVELVNLRGNLASERDNIALKLSDGLQEDCALRRFSIITFDTDVPANVKAIRRHVEEERVVGYIAAHQPDFEFANFALEELVEIAAQLDEELGFCGAAVRKTDWTGIARSRDLESLYKAVSERKQSLKGAEWGRALAQYAISHPDRADTQAERPIWRELRAALQARTVNYDYQSQEYMFDGSTFACIPRTKEY
ncbi:hypothetical protein [Desulfurivibrio alkaliphilus]|uniref:hypothetical protein n=1 Tax=Desulfurivibrio alkaliphilus TaxID=427923 RepID=UPI0012FEB833|nr:hypothetical protein [Desulfurivibrio alkaliphilus]